MIQTYELILHPGRPCNGQCDWGYRMYAALLQKAPDDFGARLHADAVTPVSQYLAPLPDGDFRWTVTLLGRDSRESLQPVLEQADSFYLRHDHLPLQVRSRSSTCVESAEQLLSLSQGGAAHSLEFITPACFKRRGKYLPLPDPRLILQSQIKKWNGCFPDCPIEDEGQGLEALADGLQLEGFQISQRSYWLKGQPIPGFVGTMGLQNRLEGFHRVLADGLLAFSGYAGIGIKTSLGMGGTRHKR